jgi:phytoene dehydrogenase-like protein
MEQSSEKQRYDAIVVGAGLAGLTAAAYLGRAGKRVVVLEKSTELGGRGASRRSDGFCLNLGPHALYAAGAGVRVLAELGVSFRGAKPDAGGGYAIFAGKKQTLPGGFVSLLSTGLFGIADKLELARVLGSVGRIDPAPWEARTVREWVHATVSRPRVRAFLTALVRLTSYANADDAMSAGAAIRQVKQAVAGSVYYLDDGWQSLVDGLAAAVTQHRVTIRTGVKVERLIADAGVRGVVTSDGESIDAEAIVLTTPPAVASALAGAAAGGLADCARSAVAIRAACLDLALSRLPVASTRFALGIDAPLYFSVHSAVAKLAPAGGALIHVAKYLETGPSGDSDVRGELEALVDLLQPGWRDVVVSARYLPKMTVVEAAPLADRGGLGGRPAVTVAELAGLYLAGDWIGEEGMLADASFASARKAAAACVEHLARDGRRRAAA